MRSKGQGKILQVGNSKGVVVPFKLVRQLGIKAGDQVDYSFNPQTGSITYRLKGVIQLSLT